MKDNGTEWSSYEADVLVSVVGRSNFENEW